MYAIPVDKNTLKLNISEQKEVTRFKDTHYPWIRTSPNGQYILLYNITDPSKNQAVKIELKVFDRNFEVKLNEEITDGAMGINGFIESHSLFLDELGNVGISLTQSTLTFIKFINLFSTAIKMKLSPAIF